MTQTVDHTQELETPEEATATRPMTGDEYIESLKDDR